MNVIGRTTITPAEAMSVGHAGQAAIDGLLSRIPRFLP